MSTSANTAGISGMAPQRKQHDHQPSEINGTKRTGETALLSVEPPRVSDLQVLPSEYSTN